MALEADLVLEDGSQVATANTYALLVVADPYHDLRGNTEWASAGEDDRATALVNAAQYLDFRWTFDGVPTFPGDSATPGQALEWPRDSAGTSGLFLTDCRGREWEMDEIPIQIIHAQLEYALAYLVTGRLLPDPTPVDTGDRAVKSKREKLGPLEEEIRYSESSSARVIRMYTTADRILRTSGLLSLANSRLVVRA